MAMGSGLWGNALKQEIKSTFGHFITMGAFLEQLPYEENRIALSSSKVNEDGDPAAVVHFSLMRDYEKRGYKEIVKVIKSLYKEMGATKVRTIMKPSVSGHYMGCHRIGNDPATSPTDVNCETHEVKNLFLCGNGSFPTGGISNPTLTAVALSLKMADTIIKKHAS
jgi:choline dehydrogenase-like flavoprotein